MCGAGSCGSKIQPVFFIGVPAVLGPYTILVEASKDLDVEIAIAKGALARAYKALQELKVNKQQILSASTVPMIPSGGPLLTGLIP